LNGYKTRAANAISPREVRLMHTGGDVEVGRRVPLAGGPGVLRARGVAWG